MSVDVSEMDVKRGHERGIAFLAGRTTCAHQRRGVGQAMLMQPSGKSGEREQKRGGKDNGKEKNARRAGKVEDRQRHDG